MHASLRSLVAVCALACATAAVLAQAPAPVQEADVKIYEAFRAWIGQQPPGDNSTILDRYRKILAGEGLSTTEVERRIAVVIEQGQKLEVERWNRILTAPTPTFNVKPNAFL